MKHRSAKWKYFCLEGTNSLGAAFYFAYFFFFLKQEFHFGNQGNLAVVALHGFVYMVFSRWAGQVAQRHGYIPTFRIGCLLVAFALIGASFVRHSLVAQLSAFVIWTCGMCLTWPPLQGLVADREPRARTARLVGIYNLVWAGLAAVANFFGGAVYERLGADGLLWLPAGLGITMAIAASWIGRKQEAQKPGSEFGSVDTPSEARHPRNRRFLTLARLANRFAYVGINTMVAMIPQIAHELGLSPTQSGWVNSVWLFARWGTFLLLWQWMGWHYRLRWLLMAFLALIAGFLLVITSNTLALLVAGQLLFGLAIGLLYYSSLFYSMDASDAKGEHGGLHESAIGLGTFVGPALGATAVALKPDAAHPAAWAVGMLLVVGFAVFLWLTLRVGNVRRACLPVFKGRRRPDRIDD